MMSSHPHSLLLRPGAEKSCSRPPHLCASCSEPSLMYPSVSCFENVRLPCTSLACLKRPLCHSPTPIPLLSCWPRQVRRHSLLHPIRDARSRSSRCLLLGRVKFVARH